MENNNQRLLIGIGIAFILVIALIAVVCLFVTFIYPNYLAAPTQPGPEAINTQAAQTIIANLTQTAPVQPTDTVEAASPIPSDTLPPTNTLPPTETPTPTLLPTATQVPPSPTPVPPTPTPTPVPCNWAQFVADVTVKDGTVFPPNAMFTKTWRLKNIGTCSWTRDYMLSFDSGAQMDGPNSVQIGEVVDPGESVDLSVELVAPVDAGKYRGYWNLRTPRGQEFGIGEDADNAFWVEISVIESDKFVYDFALNYCLAQWSSDAGDLPCPGVQGDEDGFVYLVGNPVIEKGRLENEPALWTVPEQVNDGLILGEYPALRVEQGYKFRTVIGCLNDAKKCDVVFQLNYRLGNQDYQTLYQFRETYDGVFTTVDLDLSSLAGQDVKFILTVLANGSAEGDDAFWLQPRIED
jgi:hypothetical protein